MKFISLLTNPKIGIGTMQPLAFPCPNLPLSPFPQEYTYLSLVKASICFAPQAAIITYFSSNLLTKVGNDFDSFES